jgi:hypothetical protein
VSAVMRPSPSIFNTACVSGYVPGEVVTLVAILTQPFRLNAISYWRGDLRLYSQRYIADDKKVWLIAQALSIALYWFGIFYCTRRQLFSDQSKSVEGTLPSK